MWLAGDRRKSLESVDEWYKRPNSLYIPRPGPFESSKKGNMTIRMLWRGPRLERIVVVVGQKRGQEMPNFVLGSTSPYWQKRWPSKSPTSSGENFTLSFWVLPAGTVPEEGSTEKGGRETSFQCSVALSRVLTVCSVPWLSWSFWEEPGGKQRQPVMFRVCSERAGRGSPLTGPEGASVGSVGSPLLAGILNLGHWG